MKDTEARIKELEKKLKSRESDIENLQEKLRTNKDMLQDVIQEKNQIKLRLQEYDLNLTDAKLSQYQKLQEDHQKLVHRLQVMKKHLDDARDEIAILREIIDDLTHRGLFDRIRGRYPESLKKYKK
jgi:chromosome segregation ATPase